MRIARLFFILLIASAAVHASTLAFNPYFTTEGSPSDFAVQVVFNDDVAGRPDAIEATVTLTPGRYVGDIVAFYVNVLQPMPAPASTIAGAIQGSDITGWAVDTADVQGGNIGEMFTIGLAVGRTGIGGDKGDIHSTRFTFNTPGLQLEHVSAVGVRVMSVGADGGPRDLSRKMYAESGPVAIMTLNVAETPEPSSLAFMASGVAVVIVFRRRRSAA